MLRIFSVGKNIINLLLREQELSANTTLESTPQGGLTDKQRLDLDNPKIQERYKQAYRLQQARRSCPGCGDNGLMF
jgi:hypothetical protein